MLRNYIIVVWRNLKRNPVFSVINISGLAIGLMVCMLILEYVKHENSYDSFHKNAGRIYWVETKVNLQNDSFFTSTIDYKLAAQANQQAPSIENFIRTRKEDADAIIQNTASPSLKFAETKFIFADSNFFSFFSFPLLQGSKEDVLKDPSSIVISKRAAEKYFGRTDPVGKFLRYNNSYSFIVSGVADNPPSNSSITYDFVAPASSLLAMKNEKGELPGDESGFTAYFLLKQPVDVAKLEASLQQLDKQRQTSTGVFIRYIAVPLTSTHLNASLADASNTKYLKVFPFVAGLILLLALINYMSLSTATATVRAREIGVRKVMGASRQTIATQFFAESALFTAISFLLGYIICQLMQPVFFHFLQIDIDHSFLYNPYMLLYFAVLFVISVVLAATYPSVLLSAYKPVMVLYGRFSKQAGAISVRKFFTVFQFTISVVLIICALVINRQVDFIQHTDTGVNRSNIVMVPFTQTVGKHYPAFKKANQSITAIEQVSAAQYGMYKGYDISVIKPKTGNGFITFPHLNVDENFIPMLGLKWKDAPSDPQYYVQKNATIINEAAAEKFALGKDAVNKSVEGAFTVTGVLKDFNYESLQTKIGPMVISFSKDNDSSGTWAQGGGCFFARIKPGANTAAVLQQMKAIYEKYDNDKPFEYFFMDETFDAIYKAEERLSKIFTVFTMFTLLIAGLGLFGLSTFIVVQRTKEIGIRKVLGATVANIAILLSKDFVKLVMIAIVIAFPIAWWAMHNWLQGFAYRINIGWEIFAVTAAAASIIALMTIGYRVVRAAVANPVKSLRAE